LKEEINKTVQELRSGGVILYPTDTVWGLGCDPTNVVAVRKLCKVKKREFGRPLIVLIQDIGQLYDYVQRVPDVAWDILEYSEKPLTMILPGGKGLAKEVLGEDGSVAIRLLKEGFGFDLLRRFNKGLVSTSANVSGEPTPRLYKDLSKQILDGVDYIVNCRYDTTKGKASRIIKVGLNGEYQLIRD